MYLALPFLLCICVLVKTQNRTTLHVGVLLELTDHWYSPYVGYYDDVLEYAFREIEEREDILPEFAFKMAVKDTKVSTFRLIIYNYYDKLYINEIEVN